MHARMQAIFLGAPPCTWCLNRHIALRPRQVLRCQEWRAKQLGPTVRQELAPESISCWTLAARQRCSASRIRVSIKACLKNCQRGHPTCACYLLQLFMRIRAGVAADCPVHARARHRWPCTSPTLYLIRGGTPVPKWRLDLDNCWHQPP